MHRQIYFVLLLSSVLYNLAFTYTENHITQSKEITPETLSAKSFNPLSNVALNSPRDTLTSFIENISLAHYYASLVVEEDFKAPFFKRSKIRDMYSDFANTYLNRAKACLDLSDIASVTKESLGTERAILLKEVLDKIPFTLDSLPDAKELSNDTNKNLKRWSIGGTVLKIDKFKQEGFNTSYKFSRDTMNNVHKYYELINEYPYIHQKKLSAQYIPTPGFYNFYINTPGLLVPPPWSKYIPHQLNKMVLNQTILQWIFIFLLGLSYLLLLYYIWKSCKLDKGSSSMYYQWKRIIKLSLPCLIFSISTIFLENEVRVTGSILLGFDYFAHLVMYITLAITVFLLAPAISSTLFRKAKTRIEITKRDGTKALLLIFTSLLAVYILIDGMGELGLSIVPVITSLGVAGLAIAMAVRSTFANVVGSFMIHSDQPYNIGDWIKLNQYYPIEGKVEGVGFRSTKLRLKSGEFVNIPNDKIVKIEIINYSSAKYIRKELNVNILEVDTPEEIEKTIQILHNKLTIKKSEDGSIDTSHPFFCINKYKPPNVNFNEFTTSGFTITIQYWFTPPDVPKCEDFNSYLNKFIFTQLHQQGLKILK